MILVSIGVLIIVAIFAGIFVAIGKISGWRVALSTFGIAIAATALVACASLLISVGVSQLSTGP